MNVVLNFKLKVENELERIRWWLGCCSRVCVAVSYVRAWTRPLLLCGGAGALTGSAASDHLNQWQLDAAGNGTHARQPEGLPPWPEARSPRQASRRRARRFESTGVRLPLAMPLLEVPVTPKLTQASTLLPVLAGPGWIQVRRGHSDGPH